MTASSSSLADLRHEIDRIDESIQLLMMEFVDYIVCYMVGK